MNISFMEELWIVLDKCGVEGYLIRDEGSGMSLKWGNGVGKCFEVR